MEALADASNPIAGLGFQLGVAKASPSCTYDHPYVRRIPAPAAKYRKAPSKT